MAVPSFFSLLIVHPFIMLCASNPGLILEGQGDFLMRNGDLHAIVSPRYICCGSFRKNVGMFEDDGLPKKPIIQDIGQSL